MKKEKTNVEINLDDKFNEVLNLLPNNFYRKQFIQIGNQFNINKITSDLKLKELIKNRLIKKGEISSEYLKII